MPKRVPFPTKGSTRINAYVNQYQRDRGRLPLLPEPIKIHWKYKLLGVFILLVFFVIFGWAIAELAKKEDFAGVYEHWSKELQEMKEKHQIGKPSGLLSYIPRQTSCHSSSNLFVQPNVTFRPQRRKNGCTFIDMKYPG